EEQAQPPSFLHGETVQQCAEAEEMVVVADHYIAPAHHFLREVVGTDRVLERKLSRRLPVEPSCAGGGPARLRQAIVETGRERTGLAMAFLVGVLAGLFARHQFEDPEGRLCVRGSWATADQLQCIEREPPP